MQNIFPYPNLRNKNIEQIISSMNLQFPSTDLMDKTLGALIPQFINHVLFFVGIHET